MDSRAATSERLKALPDCRWHSVQWQAYTAIGGEVML
jgi:hypothetical protein